MILKIRMQIRKRVRTAVVVCCFVAGYQFTDRARERKGKRTEKGRKNRVAANNNSKLTYTEQRERGRKERKSSRGQTRSKKKRGRLEREGERCE